MRPIVRFVSQSRWRRAIVWYALIGIAAVRIGTIYLLARALCLISTEEERRLMLDMPPALPPQVPIKAGTVETIEPIGFVRQVPRRRW
jgi:hypothetical protein